MACNSSGWYDPSLGASFGIISYDWSNGKALWAAAKPMNDEEMLVQQAINTAAEKTPTKVFTYFNLVKALPWYTSVREKIADPAYAGWFLRFDPKVTPHVPACDAVTKNCSVFYHDQEQTPAVSGGDGKCEDYCDCGPGIPCGEYLWDHRNATLRPFLVNLLLGPSFLGANGGNTIHGLFIDDFWCSNLINGTGACTDPVQGPTEIDAHSQVDMGLSDNDIADITRGWLQTMTQAQAAIVAAGGYTWSLIPRQANANASPMLLSRGATCITEVRGACKSDSEWQRAPLMFGITPSDPKNASAPPLPFFETELAAFLIMRGPHAYIGYGEWGMTWPPALPLPSELTSGDWGQPLGLCEETAAGSGIFERSYENAKVTLDCNTYKGSIVSSAELDA